MGIIKVNKIHGIIFKIQLWFYDYIYQMTSRKNGIICKIQTSKITLQNGCHGFTE